MEQKKILVVDEDQELLELIGKTLSNEGLDPITVTTAEDAMDRARTEPPDLILIDIILPDMEGPEAVRALSEDPLTKNIPVIFLSGIVTRKEKGEAASEVLVGQRRYQALSKPFSSKELMIEVRKALYK
jgi:CheY-like chemotaxis protein